LSGSFGCWAHKAGDVIARPFDGTTTGLLEALSYAATVVPPLTAANGCVTVFPSSGPFSIPTIPVGVVLIVIDGGNYRIYSTSGEVYESASTNVLKYATFQAAVDATPTGGTLFIPKGNYTHATTPAWTGATVSRAMKILGEHRYGVQLRNAGTGSQNQHGWNVTSPNGVEIGNMTVVGVGSLLGPGYGDLIRWYSPGQNMWGLRLHDLDLMDPPAWGLKFMCDPTKFFQTIDLDRVQHATYSTGPGGGASSDPSAGTHPYASVPTGSGDCWLGGGVNTGGNNSRFKDHEMQGPSYGGWDTGRTLPALTCNLSGTTITLVSGSFYDKRVFKDAGVTGTGIPANTKVVSINSATSITVNNSMTTGSSVACTFKERQQFGNLHIDQCNDVKFRSTSFQGVDNHPSVTMRYFCTGLSFSDLYIETLLGALPENDFRFVIDGVAHSLSLDMRYYKSTRGTAAGAAANRSSRFMKLTDGAVMYGARVKDAVIYRWDTASSPTFTGPMDDIDFALDTHEILIDNLVYMATDGNIYETRKRLGTSRKGVEQALPGVMYTNGVSAQNMFRIMPVDRATLSNVQDGTVVLHTDGHYYCRRAGAWDAVS